MEDAANRTETKAISPLIASLLAGTAFGMAFGVIEASVVVYLRRILYPGGFTFPLADFSLTDMGRSILLVEVAREAATLILLASAAWLAGFNLRRRLAWFLFFFGVWDIVFYAWLRICLGWPGTLLDWDLLFLIPAPWAGPVLAPILVSLGIIGLAVYILARDHKGRPVSPSPANVLLAFTATLTIVLSFILAGRSIARSDFIAGFSWPLFVSGPALWASAAAFRQIGKTRHR